MAGKRVDPLKAKAAKQKKLAIGLCVLLVGVLAFQGPKTLKMLKGPQPVAVAAPAPVTTTPAPATGAPVTPAPAAAAGAPLQPSTEPQPAVLADSDIPVTAGDGQLLSFERFHTKDPFAQQAEGGVTPAAAAEPAASPGPVEATPISSAGSAALGGSAVSGGSFSAPAAPPGSAGGAVTAPADRPATATSISVNRVPEDVVAGASFPAADPVFMLVSTAGDGKSVQIGIAGGVYADGKDTIKLVLGKPLTLQNTADGSRFELILHTVLGFVPPKTKPQK